MQLCLVKGTVVCSAQHPAYRGETLRMVRPILPDGRETGKMFIAIDRVGAAPGDTAIVLREGSSARTIYGDQKAPIHAVICGLVDEIQMRLEREKS